MRVQAMAVAAALVLAACGGKGGETAGESTGAAPVEPAPVSATGGTTHVVEMIQDGANYKFSPAELTIKAGDVVTFKSVSGGAHNVQFHADSIPTGAAAVLEAAITEKQGPLATALKMPGEEISISFAGAPTGEYRFTCLPHMAMGMHGKITVQ